MKSDVISQYVSNRMRYFNSRTSKDPASVAKEAITLLDKEWNTIDNRLKILPGKIILSTLNAKLQEQLGISITSSQIIRAMRPEEIPSDLREILRDLNSFANRDYALG